MNVNAAVLRCLGLGMLSLVLSHGLLTSAHAQPSPVTPNTNHITVAQLLIEMKEPSQPRSDAIDMYLLGIFDVTEGRVWCEFRDFKIGTLREAVYEQLSQLTGEALTQRAAPAISAALAKRFPCR